MSAGAPVGQLTDLASRLRSAAVRAFVVATGAGAGIQDALWRVPGCSSFLSGAAFPYDEDAITEFLGFRPERFASNEIALDLATAAYMQALRPLDSSKRTIGLGLCASVATTREHRGEHRVHIAAVSATCALGRTLLLEKGTGVDRRALDGHAADEAALRVLFDAAGLARDAAVEDWSVTARERFFARPYWDEHGRRFPESEVPRDVALFPGAFDPPHEGHLALAASGGVPAAFAVCASPPHKPALAMGDLLARAKLLRGQRRLFTEGDPLYLDKARRFPGRTFLIGVDALSRMLDPRWGTPVEPMLEEFQRLEARFRVAGRLVDGVPLQPNAVIATISERFRGLGYEDVWMWMLAREQEPFAYVTEPLVSWRFALFPLPLKIRRKPREAGRIFQQLVRDRWGIDAVRCCALAGALTEVFSATWACRRSRAEIARPHDGHSRAHSNSIQCACAIIFATCGLSCRPGLRER